MLICQLTDLHMRPPGLTANRVSETNMFAERAFRRVARLEPLPDVVVITGDLTERGMEGGYANLARLIRRYLPMPVYVTTGNHDEREQLRSGLQHLPGVVADPQYVQYTVDDLPVRIVMLDTLVPGSAHGILTDAQLAWLDQALSAVTDKPTMIGMHHPPFACGVGYMDRINLRNAAAFTAIIARHKQVQRVICGHHHRSIVTHVAQAIGSICPSVAHQVELSFHPDDPGAFLFEPPAFQLHLWDPADGFVTHTVYVEDFPGPYPFLSEANSAKPG